MKLTAEKVAELSREIFGSWKSIEEGGRYYVSIDLGDVDTGSLCELMYRRHADFIAKAPEMAQLIAKQDAEIQVLTKQVRDSYQKGVLDGYNRGLRESGYD